jgi:hypothetical protein
VLPKNRPPVENGAAFCLLTLINALARVSTNSIAQNPALHNR